MPAPFPAQRRTFPLHAQRAGHLQSQRQRRIRVPTAIGAAHVAMRSGMSRVIMRHLSELHDVDAELIVIAPRTHQDVVGERPADQTVQDLTQSVMCRDGAYRRESVRTRALFPTGSRARVTRRISGRSPAISPRNTCWSPPEPRGLARVAGRGCAVLDAS